MRDVTAAYGNFVCENLPHYGDCTDVALRLARSGHGSFQFRASALALKQRPIRDFTKEACAQTLAAHWYDDNKTDAAQNRINEKRPAVCVDARRQGEVVWSRPYAPRGAEPPKAGSLDEQWSGEAS